MIGRISLSPAALISGFAARMLRFSLTPAFALLLGVLRLSAHDTWLQPATFQTAPEQRVLFDLTSGGRFATLDSAIAPDRIDAAQVRLNGSSRAIAPSGRTEHSLQFSEKFDLDGVATVWVTILPRPIELNSRTVALYLDEIHASKEVRATWARWKRPEAWKEIYTKHAKTLLSVGDASTDPSWNEPVGQRLEIVPVTNPFSIRVGASASFRLLYEGKPLAGAALGVRSAGVTAAKFQTTDADGRATFPIANAGKILVFSVRLEFREDQGMWVSDFATLTINAAGS